MSRASRAALAALQSSPTIKYGDYNVTRDWMYVTSPLNGWSNQAGLLVFNPNNPSERFTIEDPNSQEAQQIYDYAKPLGDYSYLERYFPDQASVGPYAERNTFSGLFAEPTLQEKAEQKRLADLQAQYEQGNLTADQLQAAANSSSAFSGYDDVYRRTYEATGGTGSSGSASTGTSGSKNTPLPASVANMPPQFQELYRQLQTYLEKLKANGQVINPNVQITPGKLAEFAAQASKEIDPYYAEQLKIAKDNFLVGLGYNQTDVENQERQLEQQYGRSLRSLGESAAERGFAQSGLRRRDEQDLATDTQEKIDTGRRSLARTTGDTARQFAQVYGSTNLANPTLKEAPTVVAGESRFSKGTRDLPFYQISPDVYSNIVGTQEFQRRSDLSRRASELESAYRTQQGIDQLRKLTL